MTNPLPNFFIVGAPRCGTTAMSDYLSRHPEIFVAPVKEMHHFGADIINEARYKDRATYLAEFAGAAAKPGVKRIGEASVWYLYSELAAAEIKAFDPEARAIIMLRNPVEMVRSLHAKLLLIGPETEPDFGRALGLEASRRAEVRRADGSAPLRPWFYREVGKYARHVERYRSVLGRDRVLIILHEDLRRDPAEVYRRTLAFLEVDPEFKPELAPVNQARRARSLALHRFLRQPPAWMLRLRRALLPASVHPGRFLMEANLPPAPPPELETELRLTLAREFAPDVERLGRVLGRDLTDWIM
jgi:hypothetical protein